MTINNKIIFLKNMGTKREIVLSLDEVSLRIPVFSKTELSLKKIFL